MSRLVKRLTKDEYDNMSQLLKLINRSLRNQIIFLGIVVCLIILGIVVNVPA